MSAAPDWEKKAREFQDALLVTSRQSSETLERLGGFRVGVTTVLKRAYPGLVAGVEKSLGGHISDLPDAVLLGYLEAFSTMSQRGSVMSPNDLSEIRRALRDSGFPMDDDSTALEMGLAIREGFSAAKYDNQRLRKNKRSQPGATKGSAGIQRDLSWAESQNFSGVKTKPAETPQNVPAGKPENNTPAGSETSAPQGSRKRRRKKKPNTLPLFQDPANTTGTPEPTTAAPAVSEDRFAGLTESLIPDELRDKEKVEPAPEISEEREIPAAILRGLETRLHLPAPVFMRDVVQTLGSAEDAADWEKAQRGKGDFSFINAQGKHRQRGSLIIPVAEKRPSIHGFNESPWGRTLAQDYNAGRTYDLAVILAILGETLIAISYTKYTVEITYRGTTGLEAIVVALAPGPDPWADVESAVGELLNAGPFDSLTVVSCPNGSVNSVCDTLFGAAKANDWPDVSQVGIQQLTEWVTDRGRNATMVPAP